MKLIVAVDEHWGIGYQNGLLFHIKEDMRYFRAHTMGNVVIMGRKTLLSMPNGAPLKGRENIVLTRDEAYGPSGVHVCHTLPMLRELLSQPPCAGKAHYVIGGAQIYTLLLPYASEAYVTHVQAVRKADCMFPRLAELSGWTLAESSPLQEADGLAFTFAVYKNEASLPLPE